MESLLAELALDRLRDLVTQPQWRNGGKLPPETELSREIGVSRPILRRALIVLRQEGVIESRRGSGNFVRRQEEERSSVFGKPQNLGDIESCFRFRLVIESAAAAEAARQAGSPRINEIEKAAEAMEESRVRDDTVFDIDFAFHLAVAAASENHYFDLTLQFLRPHIEVGYLLSRQIRNIPPNLTSRRVAIEHREILAAIRTGIPDAARQKMEDHLRASIERLFGKQA